MKDLDRFALEHLDRFPQADKGWVYECPFDVPHAWANIIERLVDDGKAKVVAIKEDDKEVAYIVYQVEKIDNNELVIIAAYSNDKTSDWTSLILDDIVPQLMEKFNCISVRFHTIRKGLIRKSINHGYRVSEVVMRKFSE